MIDFTFTLFVFPEVFVYYTISKLKLVKYIYLSTHFSKKNGYWGIISRRLFYRMTLKKCGNNLIVHYGSILTFSDIEIGDNCTIETYCILGHCSLGNDVILASRVTVLSGGNARDPEDTSTLFRNQRLPAQRVCLGNDLWIGTHSVIMANVGDRVVIGAGSVITKEAPSKSIVVGVPGKVLKNISQDG